MAASSTASSDIGLFWFGKYKNQPIDEVVRKDPSYVRWAYLTVKDHGISQQQFKAALQLLEAQARLQAQSRSCRDSWDAFFWECEREQYVEPEPKPQPVYYADGSGYLPAHGPCGPLYFDRNGET